MEHLKDLEEAYDLMEEKGPTMEQLLDQLRRKRVLNNTLQKQLKAAEANAGRAWGMLAEARSDSMTATCAMHEPETEHGTTHAMTRARQLICGDRAREYGLPSVSFPLISQAWQAYDKARGDRPEDGRDIAWKFAISKGIRDAYRRKRDNPDDGIGFLQIAAWLETQDMIDEAQDV